MTCRVVGEPGSAVDHRYRPAVGVNGVAVGELLYAGRQIEVALVMTQIDARGVDYRLVPVIATRSEGYPISVQGHTSRK